MNNTKNKKVLFVSLIVCIALIIAGFLSFRGTSFAAHASSIDDLRDGYSIDDVQGMLMQQSDLVEMEIYSQVGIMQMMKVPDVTLNNSQFSSSLAQNGVMALAAPSFNEQKIVDSGKPDNQSVVITIMGDGFTNTQQTNFITAAKNAMDYMLGNPTIGATGWYPYNLLRCYFNW